MAVLPCAPCVAAARAAEALSGIASSSYQGTMEFGSTFDVPVKQMAVQTLAEAGLHIWHARLDEGASSVQHYRNVLAASELDRAAKFHFSVHQQRYIIAHGVLRHVLCLYTGGQPADVPISQLDCGKPVLIETALEFNLSHSHARVAIAIARRQVGIDIEHVRPLPDAVALAKRYLSESEAVFINQVPEQSRSLEFLRIWTRKEAFLKGRGLGLRVPVSIAGTPENDAEGNPTSGIEEHPSCWRFGEFWLDSDYLGSVAVHGGFDRIDTFYWE